MQIKQRFFPEVGAGGFSSLDGTVAFYGRVNALLTSDMRVLDFGAGRGAWHHPDAGDYRSRLRLLRGKVSEVVACDVDEAVLRNRSADRQVRIEVGAPLPFPDAHFDLIVADWVFEHISEPQVIAAELFRVLKPGGWICARTPNALGYVALASRLVPNAWHARALRHIQPGREEQDVFPTCYRLNTRRQLKRIFRPQYWEHYSCYRDAEPAYHFNWTWLYGLQLLIGRLLPPPLRPFLFVFLKKERAAGVGCLPDAGQPFS